MTEREFIVEVRRGLGIILRAMMRRYALALCDLLPAELRAPVSPPQWLGAGEEPHAVTTRVIAHDTTITILDAGGNRV